MPPSRPLFRQCTCEECIKTNARGVLMDSKLIPAHLKHIRDKHSGCNPSQPVHSQTTPSRLVDTPRLQTDTDNLAAHLFALALTDDGPDQNGTASKLWESRAAYRDVNGSPDPLPVSDIADSLSRLTLCHPTPLNCPPVCDMAPVPDPCPTPLPPSQGEQSDSVVRNAHNMSIYIPQCPTSVPSPGVSKKDTNQHSVKALELLSNIEKRCQGSFRLLLDPSGTSLTALQEELVVLHHALQGVRRNTADVNSRKEEVAESLRKLDAELQSRAPSPPIPLGSLQFDSGEVTSFFMRIFHC